MLVPLAKMCIEKTQYQIWVEHMMFEVFDVCTGLKQGDSLSLTSFIGIVFEKAIRKVLRKTTRVTIGQHCIQVLKFADGLNVLRSS